MRFEIGKLTHDIKIINKDGENILSDIHLVEMSLKLGPEHGIPEINMTVESDSILIDTDEIAILEIVDKRKAEGE